MSTDKPILPEDDLSIDQILAQVKAMKAGEGAKNTGAAVSGTSGDYDIYSDPKAYEVPEEVLPPEPSTEPEEEPVKEDSVAEEPLLPAATEEAQTISFPNDLNGATLRERFFRNPVLERTDEHEIPGEVDLIERPGIVLKKGVPSGTSDLEPLPTILPAEVALEEDRLAQEKTIVAGAHGQSAGVEKQADDILDGQIVLRGFEIGEPPRERLRPEDAEKELAQKRSEKAKNFVRLVKAAQSGEDENEESLEDEQYEASEDESVEEIPKEKKKDFEYRHPDQKNRVYKYIESRKRQSLLTVTALALTGLAALFLNALPSMLENSVSKVLLALEGTPILLAHLLVLLTASFFGMSSIISGFRGIFRLNPNCDSAISFAVTVNAVQIITRFFLPAPERSVPIYTAAVIFAMMLNYLARSAGWDTAKGNFRFCAYDWSQDLHAVAEIEDPNEAFELCRGTFMSDPSALYSKKIDFPSDFIEGVSEAGPAERFCRILFPITAGVSLFAGLLAGAIGKDAVLGFSVFSAAACLGIPAGSLLAANVALRRANRQLNETGSMIISLKAAEDVAKSNALVMDSAEIFDRSRCEMNGIFEHGNIRLDLALLYAIALVLKSEGPLAEAFAKIVEGNIDLVPAVRSFVYEDRQGMSGTIENYHSVLLGNRTFLINHSVPVPSKSDEDKYKVKGRKLFYLAIEGKLSIMFSVTYVADESLIPYLKTINENGIQLLLRANDPNITEELIVEHFKLPTQKVKVIGAIAGRMFKRIRERRTKQAPARVLHNGSHYSLVRTVAACTSLSFRVRAAQIAQVAGVGFNLALIIVLALTSAAGKADAGFVIALQGASAALAVLIAAIKKIR